MLGFFFCFFYYFILGVNSANGKSKDQPTHRFLRRVPEKHGTTYVTNGGGKERRLQAGKRWLQVLESQALQGGGQRDIWGGPCAQLLPGPGPLRGGS